MNNLFFIGFMGSGKSAVCGRLHELTGMEVIEMDASIVDSERMSINDIFATKGEQYFRDLETKLLSQISEESRKAVSCGGGAILRPENVELMKKSGKIILLSATPETIYNRVKDTNDRPLLNGKMNEEYISALMEKRRARYEEVADHIIDTTGKTIPEVCDLIISALHT